MERKIGKEVINTNEYIFLNKTSIVDCAGEKEIKHHEKEIEEIMNFFSINHNLKGIFTTTEFVDLYTLEEKNMDYFDCDFYDIDTVLEASVSPYTGVDYYLNKDNNSLICYSFEEIYSINQKLYSKIRKVTYNFKKENHLLKLYRLADLFEKRF